MIPSPGGPPFGARVALSRILAVLGSSLLTARWLPDAAPGDGEDRDVRNVVIWDEADPPGVSGGDLVLGVGVHDAEAVAALAKRLGPSGVAALVVKLDASEADGAADRVVDASREAGVPLLQLIAGASWEQISTLVRSLLVSVPRSAEVVGGDVAVHDLFDLAEVIGSVLGAAVTIEDRSLRVLAFSELQGGVDTARTETVLGRQVPERYRLELERRGIFRRLLADEAPVFVEPLEDGMLPRTAVSVRAGNELLGSLWAATPEPLPPARSQWLVEAARLVAYHMLRLRSETDVRRRVWAEHVATLLAGGEWSLETAARLGLAPGPACVVAAAPREDDPARAEAELQRLTTLLSVHLRTVRPKSAVARVGAAVYAVVSPVEVPDMGERAASLMQTFVDDADQKQAFLFGVGRAARSFNQLVQSRGDADRALRVLRRSPRGRSVARFVDVQAESLLLRLGDLVAEDGGLALGPLEELAAYDERHGAELLATLGAYLDALGDVRRASHAVFVHPNTFRYRLHRIAEISGIDVDDPESRFGVMLQLRLRELVGDERGEGA